jgi:hypothetical protein
VKAAFLRQPRPAPGRLVPTIAGGSVLMLGLPIFVLAEWRVKAWGLAAVLWVGSQMLGVLLGRLRVGMDSLASSGVLAIGMMFRAIVVMVVLVAVAVSDASLALAAAGLYAVAYTCELAFLLATYFGNPAR